MKNILRHLFQYKDGQKAKTKKPDALAAILPKPNRNDGIVKGL
jgi:hypothetical protein